MNIHRLLQLIIQCSGPKLLPHQHLVHIGNRRSITLNLLSVKVDGIKFLQAAKVNTFVVEIIHRHHHLHQVVLFLEKEHELLPLVGVMHVAFLHHRMLKAKFLIERRDLLVPSATPS